MKEPTRVILEEPDVADRFAMTRLDRNAQAAMAALIIANEGAFPGLEERAYAVAARMEAAR